MFGAATPLHAALLVLVPPTQAIGAAGVFIGVVNCLLCLGAAVFLARSRRIGFGQLLEFM